tara:strand:+ start:634 stop:840 length:207 start_codon:yes stop_codon:yes gene_type:complete
VLRVRELRVSAPNGLLWPINRHWSSKKAMGEDCLFPPPSLFPAINQFSMVIAQIAERHNSNGRKGITV